MRPRLRASLTAAATIVASLALSVPSASAGGPVCADPIPRALCGGRVFAEPLQSVSGLTYAQLVQGMTQLAADHPDWVSFTEFGEGSADGNALYVAEVTMPYDPTGVDGSPVPLEDRKIVLVNQSIHGNEPGGREGAPRYVEDLVTGVDEERTALLAGVRLIQTFINPDGWSAGDHDHVQTGGGAYLWARQNGEGSFSGVGDFGFGIDLNRQAPWRGISHNVEPLQAPEAIAFHDFVTQLAAHGDIQASVDIHGEVNDAVGWVMLSSGQFDLDDALNQRYQGDDLDAALTTSLETSTVYDVAQEVFGDIPATVLTASSEFGSIPNESTASGTGFQGDWIAQPEGGDSASLSTIELYAFTEPSPLGVVGVNSLTARPEVMQLYRDAVAGILGSLIDSAALEHDTTMAVGDVLYVDDFARVADPVRDGVVVSAADFFTDLRGQTDGALDAVAAGDVAAAPLDAYDSVVIGTEGLLGDATAIARLRAYASAGGNVVLTDAALQLLPELVDGIAPADVKRRTDAGGKVSYDRSHPLTEGIRDIAWMNTETATMGLQVGDVTGSGNVPTFYVDRGVWEAAGGSTAGVSGGGTSVGEVAVGDGSVRTIGVLLPSPSDARADDILYGINGYGVLDTGYIVLANALDGELVRSTSLSVPEAGPVGDVVAAQVAAAPAPSSSTRTAVPAAVLVLGMALVARQLRAAREDS